MAAPESLLTAASLRPRPGLAPIAVAIVTFVACAATLLGVAPPRAALFSTLTHLTFAVPGVLIVRAVTGVRAGWLAPLTFGPLLGLAVSTFALLGLWALGARGAWALAVAPALALALAWPARRLEGRVRLASTVDADWTWLALVLLIAPVVVARAFSLVGADLPEGHAYRAYFTADYVWRRAVVGELAKGDFLPVNPFYTGDTLHYYWLAHLLNALEYVDRGGQVLIFGLNPMAVHNALEATLLSFGPVLLLGGAGAWIAWRARRADLLVVGAIVLTSVVFYFFVDIRDHGDVYVGWRVGHLVFIASTVSIAVLFERIGELPPRRRATAVAAIAVVLIAAAPTLGIDLYNTQDIENTRMGPGFRWTLVLSRNELQAFEWIKANTAPSAIFQVDPMARDSDTWAYLPAFAERRMAVGLPISMVPIGKYERGSWRVREMLSQAVPVETHHLATGLGIRYILSGPPERLANPRLQARLDSRSDLFPLLFRNGSISIYGVVPRPLVP